MPVGPSGSALGGRAAGNNSLMFVVRDARAGRERYRGLPGRGNDVVHGPLRICHSGWRCVCRPTLDGGAGSGDATSGVMVAGTGRRCLVVIIGGASPPLSDRAVQQISRGDGGDRWVAHIGVAGHRRVGHRRRSCGLGWLGHRRAVVVMPTRGGPGRGAGRSAGRSASSRSHRASSCCRRIHSASTIAAASSSRLVAHAVVLAMSLTPFPGCCAPGPAGAVDRVRR